MAPVNEKGESIKRFAFIDVNNTEKTTEKMLGFAVDWGKVCKYLEEQQGCERVFFYPGIELGDTARAEEFASLASPCVVKAKTTIVYKNPSRTISVKCSNCGAEGAKVIDMGYKKKSNCDVELTIDALENAVD